MGGSSINFRFMFAILYPPRQGVNGLWLQLLGLPGYLSGLWAPLSPASNRYRSRTSSSFLRPPAWCVASNAQLTTRTGQLFSAPGARCNVKMHP